MENLFLKKLQVKPNYKVKVVDAPENAAAVFGDVPAGVSINYDGESDFEVLVTFTTNKEQLNLQIRNNLRKINVKTIFWVFYPKKSSKVVSDLDLMKTWKELEVYGLSPCAAVAVNETWTGLRLKLITEIKASGLSNQHIQTSQYGDYINPDARQLNFLMI